MKVLILTCQGLFVIFCRTLLERRLSVPWICNARAM